VIGSALSIGRRSGRHQSKLTLEKRRLIERAVVIIRQMRAQVGIPPSRIQPIL